MAKVEEEDHEEQEDEQEEAPAAAAGANDDEDDEDDDDDDEGDGGEFESKPAGVALRGVLKVEDGRLFWAGKWADDDGAFERGETKKFKYGGPADCDDAALAAPPAGKWNGYFMNPSEEDELGKVREKGVELKFVASKGDKSSLAVTGTGENDFGAFTLRGTYTIASQRLECSKFYASNADDEEDDDDDLDPDAVDDNYDDELAGLNEEQDMPIEELMKRYGKTQDEPPAKKLRN